MFWIPPIILSAIFRENVRWLWLNIGSMSALIALSLVSLTGRSPASRWVWILAGIYVFGPLSMIIASAFAGANPPSFSTPGSFIFDAVICLLPPTTLWLSFYDGMILSVLPVTIVLGLLALFEPHVRSHE